jgi:L-iditol 2-dehydrogenase
VRALVLHGPNDFRVEPDWPAPEPRPGWAVVRVGYAGVCGSDLPRFLATGSYHHPMILGHEFTGTVAAPAPGSELFKGGEQVAVLPIIPCGECAGCRDLGPFHCTAYQFLGSRNDGGFAEYCLAPERNVLRLPPGTDPRAGAFVEPLAVGLHVVRRARFRAGDTALVFGAGPIGLLIAHWLRLFGARRVVVADVRAESLELARRTGIEEAVNPATDNLDRLPRFDLTVEAAGSGAALRAAIQRTRSRGTLAVVGRDTRDTTVPLRDFELMMRREITLEACWGYDLAGDEEFVAQVLGQGRIPLDALVTHQIALEAAPETIRAMGGRQMYFCKVLLDLA